jgi:hypothetical protein
VFDGVRQRPGVSFFAVGCSAPADTKEAVVLVELGLVEQRYKAVMEVLDGATVTDVAIRNGVVRQSGACVGAPLREPRAGRTGRSELEARVVPASDGGGGRGAHRRAAPGPSGVGSAHDPVPSQAGGDRAVAGVVVGLSVLGAPRPRRADEAQTATPGLQALGAVPGDGVVADGHRGPVPSRRWHGAVDGVGRR